MAAAGLAVLLCALWQFHHGDSKRRIIQVWPPRRAARGELAVFPDTPEIREQLRALTLNYDAWESESYRLPMFDYLSKCAPETPRGTYLVWLVWNLDKNGKATYAGLHLDTPNARLSEPLPLPPPSHLLECVKSYTAAHSQSSFPLSTRQRPASGMQEAMWIDFPVEEDPMRKLAIEYGWRP